MVATFFCPRRVRPCDLDLHMTTRFVALLPYSSPLPAFVPRFGDVVLVVGVGLQHSLEHGAWLPARKERGISYTTANRFIRLRQEYAEINQVGEFGSVSAALTGGRPVPIW